MLKISRLRLFITTTITLLFSFNLFAEPRNALLIANAKYETLGNLATPVQEAKDLKKTLEKLNFTVTIVENGSKEKILDELFIFQSKLEQSGGIGFFHYGGHAVQVAGKNYIIPVDAAIPDERRVATRAVDMDEIMESMKGDTNIVILDACRNNPLPASSGRSATRGLILTGLRPKNSIIVYSAQAGMVAQDGLFTPILTTKLSEKKSFSEILMDVRKEVRRQTNNEQSPGEYNELEESIYLAGYSDGSTPQIAASESKPAPVIENKKSSNQKEEITIPSFKEFCKIGISMPDKSVRWGSESSRMAKTLKDAGYTVELQYASGSAATQNSQIKNMIKNGCKILVITAVDTGALKNSLSSAKALGVKVISYDRLIMNTDAVSYYATFDNYKVGLTQGNYLVEKLELENRTKNNPAYIEFFTGDLADNNINFFFGGAMDVLLPYIKSGVLVCRSGQTTKRQCAIPHWSTDEAQNRMKNLIATEGYGPHGTRLDAVYSSNDSVAMGIVNALKSAGYNASNIPIVTGQDCATYAVKNIIAGTQAMSVFKDGRNVASNVIKMIDAIAQGKEPPVNDRKTYDNGTGIIPSYLSDVDYCEKYNYKSLLIDSGYYKAAEFK